MGKFFGDKNYILNNNRRNCWRAVPVILILLILIILVIIIYLLYRFNIIPHKSYSDDYFGITPYTSSVDKDGDGIDDQTDILNSAYHYIDTKPKYKSKYYEGGYPDDEYGVCTDVVAQALLGAGYDLQELVNADILCKREDYDIDEPDDNIDFRRVRNLKVYFEHTAISLTTDIKGIEEWQGGDIVIFEKHIGIVADKRNADGVPFVIHNANRFQLSYVEDILETYGKIVGHYRIS